MCRRAAAYSNFLLCMGTLDGLVVLSSTSCFIFLFFGVRSSKERTAAGWAGQSLHGIRTPLAAL